MKIKTDDIDPITEHESNKILGRWRQREKKLRSIGKLRITYG